MKNNNEKETSLKQENTLNKNKYEYKLIYYVICYAIGYVISLCVTGVPNLMYLIPIKLDALAISVITGTLWNTIHYKITGYDARRYGFLPAMVVLLLLFIILILIKVLLLFELIVDPNPFLGFTA
ncbi:hypothetical protein HBE96_16390 [Clostridium sp. P21]|uniref:Uncharacterized protein n=1 Tax=Clostridium muellerianum TaxID=2716538 RepID=A0A7Y0EIV4_9CLOT|nr:hypothetical protein [Clostridium muellerianum]NMM64206.1 hypothetical protein [Clostridium muellerianum]